MNFGCVMKQIEPKPGTTIDEVGEMFFDRRTRSTQVGRSAICGCGIEFNSTPMADRAPKVNLDQKIISVRVSMIFESLYDVTTEARPRSRTEDWGTEKRDLDRRETVVHLGGRTSFGDDNPKSREIAVEAGWRTLGRRITSV